MEENKDKKTTLTGKLQLKKTFNAGQIKQNFSHGRSKSVSVEVKKKRTFSTINKQQNVNQIEDREVPKDETNDTKNIMFWSCFNNCLAMSWECLGNFLATCC